MALVPSWKEAKGLASVSLPWRGEVSSLHPEEAPHQNLITLHLDLHLLASGSVRNKFLLSISPSPWYSVIIAPTDCCFPL